MQYALQPGEPIKLFDDDATAPVANSPAYAMPTDHVRFLSWIYSFATAPSSCSIKLQVSDDGSLWTDLDAGTATTGETRLTVETAARFVRAQKAAQSGGGNLTVQVTMSFH
jgi:hypothetical protein